MNTIHDFHASVESISQLWNLFHQVRNEGIFFTTLEFISPCNLQEQISVLDEKAYLDFYFSYVLAH
jgi:hypothetical protein